VACFLDRQYAEGDGKWADRIFTGNGDMWALRTFCNRFVLLFYAWSTGMEFAVFGHYAPYHTAVALAILVASLKAMQVVGLLQA